MQLKQNVHQALLRGAYQSRAYRLIEKLSGSLGTILMLHRVVRDKEECLDQYLAVTASHLDRTIAHFRRLGLEFVSVPDVAAALAGKKRFDGRAVALTFDDGYRDNLTRALPILEKHQIPATIYVVSGAPDRTMDVWHLRLEHIIRRSSSLSLAGLGLEETLSLSAPGEKKAAYARLTDIAFREFARFKAFLFDLLPASRVSDEQLMEEMFLSWEELRGLARHPLITIGAHTESHPILAQLSEEEAFGEMVRGRARITKELNCPADHFAYPYGRKCECGPREFRLAARAGFTTAVTTRYGEIYQEHSQHPHCLPRMNFGGPVEHIADAVLDVFGTRTAISKRCFTPVVTD